MEEMDNTQRVPCEEQKRHGGCGERMEYERSRDHGKQECHGGGHGGCGHHGHAQHGEDSLVGLLCRCGYIAERKSGRTRGQMRILQILSHTWRISQKELTDRLGIEPGSMSEVLAKLEDKGYIQREKDADDRRKMMITLTEAGKKAAGGCSEGSDDKILESLSEEEKESLGRILGKLLAHWQAERKER